MRYAPIKARNASRVSYIVRKEAIMGEVQEVRLKPISAVEFPILATVCRIPKQQEGAEAAAWKHYRRLEVEVGKLLVRDTGDSGSGVCWESNQI